MDHAEQSPQVPTAQHHPRAIEGNVSGSQPERIQVLNLNLNPGDSNGASRLETRPQSSSPRPPSNGHPTPPHSHDNPYADFERVPVPQAARSREGFARMNSRHRPLSNAALPPLPHSASGIDWIVPVEEKATERQTIGKRLEPTIENATSERDKYAKKALWTGYALNIAIGLQVFLGALTTGLAAALTTGKKAQLSTALLGGLSTMVASYMARARGSGEPELSITRTKDLEQFLRESKAFALDHGHEYGTPENRLDIQLDDFRRRFEELLGNANGERKLSPVGITPTQS